jgi:hypothetical protein
MISRRIVIMNGERKEIFIAACELDIIISVTRGEFALKF